MKILEQFICGKENDPKTCEDGLVIEDHLIAVIDGVTAKGKHLWQGKKSGCYAKDILTEYLQNDVSKQNAAELFQNLDLVLQDAIRKEGCKLSGEDYPRAAVIVYNDIYKEIWAYGDCQCRINAEVHTHAKKIDELNADLRAFYLEYYIEQGYTIEELQKEDFGRKAIQKNLQMQFAFENKLGDFGYPVLNGEGIESSMIRRYSVKEADTVILATDGYPVLKENLEDSEKELRRILTEDPMCFRQYRSTKGVQPGNASFDDRTFCRFVVIS